MIYNDPSFFIVITWFDMWLFLRYFSWQWSQKGWGFRTPFWEHSRCHCWRLFQEVVVILKGAVDRGLLSPWSSSCCTGVAGEVGWRVARQIGAGIDDNHHSVLTGKDNRSWLIFQVYFQGTYHLCRCYNPGFQRWYCTCTCSMLRSQSCDLAALQSIQICVMSPRLPTSLLDPTTREKSPRIRWSFSSG